MFFYIYGVGSVFSLLILILFYSNDKKPLHLSNEYSEVALEEREKIKELK